MVVSGRSPCQWERFVVVFDAQALTAAEKTDRFVDVDDTEDDVSVKGCTSIELSPLPVWRLLILWLFFYCRLFLTILSLLLPLFLFLRPLVGT